MNQLNVKVWACTSAGSCVFSFVQWSLPIIQWIAVAISIFAGIKALRGKK